MSEHPKSLLIVGASGEGKSTSLMNLRGQEGVLYLNCEGGKPLPFKNSFKRITIDDPLDILEYIDQVNNDPKARIHTIIIDTVSFMMNRFESMHVIGSSNTQAAWGEYGQFFPKLMYEAVAKCKAHVIFLGHVSSILNENTGVMEQSVPVKGALSKNGIEAYFTTVIGCKKMPIKKLLKYEDGNSLLNITEAERDIGFKHVYQTVTTKETIGDRLRSPLGLFKPEETFIDNDAQKVIDRLVEYYQD